MRDTFQQFTQALHNSVRTSGIVGPNEPLEVVLTWPANANGAQRHLTRSAFKEAGFSDVRMYFGSWNEWSREPGLPIESGFPSN